MKDLVKEIKALSPLRKNQQLMTFYMLFVGVILIAFTARLYSELFGIEGLILKDYAISLFGLIILYKKIGETVNKNPMETFKLSVKIEIIALVGYFIANKGFMPEAILIISTVCLISTNLMMKPLIIKVDSQVTQACSEYSVLKAKLDNIYIAFGAFVGGILLLGGIPMEISFCIMIGALIMSRHYRFLVFSEIYKQETNEKEEVSANY